MTGHTTCAVNRLYNWLASRPVACQQLHFRRLWRKKKRAGDGLRTVGFFNFFSTKLTTRSKVFAWQDDTNWWLGQSRHVIKTHLLPRNRVAFRFHIFSSRPHRHWQEDTVPRVWGREKTKAQPDNRRRWAHKYRMSYRGTEVILPHGRATANTHRFPLKGGIRPETKGTIRKYLDVLAKSLSVSLRTAQNSLVITRLELQNKRLGTSLLGVKVENVRNKK